MKLTRKIMAIIYAGTSLLLAYLFITSIFFAFTTISYNSDSIGIIGGADYPTLRLLVGSPLIMIFLSFSMIFFSIFNIIISFNSSHTSKKNWGLLIWLIINGLMFALVPPQSYVISLYSLLRRSNLFSIIFNSFFVINILIIVLTGITILLSQKGDFKHENI